MLLAEKIYSFLTELYVLIILIIKIIFNKSSVGESPSVTWKLENMETRKWWEIHGSKIKQVQAKSMEWDINLTLTMNEWMNEWMKEWMSETWKTQQSSEHNELK